jgi:hypothetical protein
VQSVNRTAGIGEIGVLQSMNSRIVLVAERRGVLDQHALMVLLAAGDQGRCKGDADAAADVPHHIDDRRGIVVLRCRHSRHGSRIDRDKQQSERWPRRARVR